MDSPQEKHEPGPTLSKFFTYNENSIQAMSEPYLWFSPLDAFNDPFEGLVEMSNNFDPDKWHEMANSIGSTHANNSGFALIANAMKSSFRTILSETREIHINELNRRFIDRLKEHGYCCLFKDKEIHDQSNILMWGHYGNGLKGFKVTYDSQLLISSLPQPTVKTAIKYSTSIPEFDIRKAVLFSENASSNNNSLEIFKILEHLSTKHKAWKYENEYRFISPKAGAHTFNASAIKEVVFGEKMPISQQKVLHLVITANSPNTIFKIARVSKNRYGLEEQCIP